MAKISDSTARQLRHLYFMENWTFQNLADDFEEYGFNTIRKAVLGIGCYSGVQDTIPKHIKVVRRYGTKAEKESQARANRRASSSDTQGLLLRK